jgi:NitT/TauT family transport system substrate-binding protein
VRRPHLRRRAAAALALAALLSAGCSAAGGTPPASSPGPLEKTNILVAAVPTNDTAGLYIAAERGLFAREGLHVKIVPAISGATVISGQLAGKYDVTFGNYVSYILADALHHADFRVLAPGSVMGPGTQQILVPQGSPIQSAAQLKGKRIAVNVPDNIGTVLVDSIFTDNALLPSPQNIHYVPMPFPDMVRALRNHQVDAAWMPEPFATMAEEQIGAQPVADANEGVTQNLPIAGYIVTQRWLDKYPHTAAAFRRAALEGQRIADTDTPAVISGVTKYAGVPRPISAILSTPGFPLTLDPQSIQRVANLMFQFSLLPHGYSTAQMTH